MGDWAHLSAHIRLAFVVDVRGRSRGLLGAIHLSFDRIGYGCGLLRLPVFDEGV